MTDLSEDAAEFDRFLAGSAPEVAATSMALRQAVLDAMPAAVEWFDPGSRLLAFGTSRTVRGLMFAIVPHKAHVNLQFVDGVDLPNPEGRLERTGKHARHIKVRSVADAGAPWLRAAVAAQLDFRSPAG